MTKKIKKPAVSYDETIALYLKNKKNRKAYLQATLDEYLENGDTDLFLLALQNIAKSEGGFSELSKKTGLNRESLYKSLSKGGNPAFRNILSILQSFGASLRVEFA